MGREGRDSTLMRMSRVGDGRGGAVREVRESRDWRSGEGGNEREGIWEVVEVLGGVREGKI